MDLFSSFHIEVLGPLEHNPKERRILDESCQLELCLRHFSKGELQWFSARVGHCEFLRFEVRKALKDEDES